LVNSKKLDFAIVATKYDTFDTVQKKSGWHQTNYSGSTNIDASELKTKIKGNDFTATENWLNDQICSHDSGIPHVKLFWCLS
jgi:hypothetical protein